MDLKHSDEDLAFKKQIENFCESYVSTEIRQKIALGHRLSKQDIVDYHKVLYEHGYAVPNWKEEWGGRDWTSIQHQIFDDVTAAYDCPRRLAFGVSMVGPVLQAFGSREQQEKYLPRIARLSEQPQNALLPQPHHAVDRALDLAHVRLHELVLDHQPARAVEDVALGNQRVDPRGRERREPDRRRLSCLGDARPAHHPGKGARFGRLVRRVPEAGYSSFFDARAARAQVGAQGDSGAAPIDAKDADGEAGRPRPGPRRRPRRPSPRASPRFHPRATRPRRSLSPIWISATRRSERSTR